MCRQIPKNLMDDDEDVIENEFIEETPNAWPINETVSTNIFACNICYYPIAFADNVIHTFLSEANELNSIVLPINTLLTEDFAGHGSWNVIEQWKRLVFCFNCNMKLTYTNGILDILDDRSRREIIAYQNELFVAILSTRFLIMDNTADMKFRYEN